MVIGIHPILRPPATTTSSLFLKYVKKCLVSVVDLSPPTRMLAAADSELHTSQRSNSCKKTRGVQTSAAKIFSDHTQRITSSASRMQEEIASLHHKNDDMIDDHEHYTGNGFDIMILLFLLVSSATASSLVEPQGLFLALLGAKCLL